jgi:hypothetical protein
MADLDALFMTDLLRADQLAGADLHRAVKRSARVAELDPQEFEHFLFLVANVNTPLSEAADRLLAHWLKAAVQSRRKAAAGRAPVDSSPKLLAAIESLYRKLSDTSHARAQLLAWLASGGAASDLDLFAELIVAAPLADDEDAMQALAPLFQYQRREAPRLFPQLLRALSAPALAAPVLDLANFLTRERLIDRHPASDVAGELRELLGELVQTLLRLEERPDHFGDSPQEVSRRVARGVALAVSLCDALALVGDKASIGKLNQALGVGHRRLKTEAAAALARLGEKQGLTELTQLAAEPVARLRVLAYAKELGISDQIDPKYTTPAAKAEAELSVWLAEPTQYGVPPTSCELVDHRKQHWPGYDEEVDCFLFRFQYVVSTEAEGEKSFSNIGIAGPLTHAFIADLGDLPPEDIYAAFAGWHAQHEDIREYDVAHLSKSEQLEVQRLKRRLHDAGYAHIEPAKMGYFLGEKALIATAQRQKVEGVAVVDFQNLLFFPHRHSKRPLGTLEAYSIYKGRKLLKAFNR